MYKTNGALIGRFVARCDRMEYIMNKTIDKALFFEAMKSNKAEACALLQSFGYYRKASKRLLQAQVSPDFDTIECGVSYFAIKEYKAEVILFGKISHLNTVADNKFLSNYIEYKGLKDLIPDKVEDLNETETMEVLSTIIGNKELPKIRTAIQEVADMFETVISNVDNM